MKPQTLIALLPLLVFSVARTPAEKLPTKDVVTLCQIPIPVELQDAQFVVTYRFEISKTGKPTNIRKVKNDLLKDEPFIVCIAGWSLPSVTGEGVADFFSGPAQGGWTEISVSAKGFNKSFSYHRQSEPPVN